MNRENPFCVQAGVEDAKRWLDAGYLEGWYFTDETADVHGPFGTKQEAELISLEYTSDMTRKPLS